MTPEERAAALTSAIDDIRVAVAKTEALANAAERSYDEQFWPGIDRQIIERLAHLIGATAEAATAALNAVDKASAEICINAPIAGANEWSDDK